MESTLKKSFLFVSLISIIVFVSCGGGGGESAPDTNENLDLTFGTEGVARYDGGFDDYGFSVAIQSDGKALVAGGSGNGTDKDLLLVRYDTNGLLDSTFGTGGVVRHDEGLDDEGIAVALQSDGKVLVAGRSGNGSNEDLVLVRVDTNGVLDSTFGTGGVARYDGGWNDYGYSVAIQSDGKVLVAGGSEGEEFNGYYWNLILCRYNINGTLDSTFGTGGVASYDGGIHHNHGRSVAIHSDGKALVAGKSYSGAHPNDLILLKYNINGILDSTFGTGGVARYDGGADDIGFSVAIQSDGKALVAGRSKNNYDFDSVLVSYDTNGQLDSVYGSGGVASYEGGFDDFGYSVAIRSDGKALVAGGTESGSDRDLVLVGYDTNGILDSTFGTGGVARYDSGLVDEGYSVAIQADGNALVAGWSGNGSDQDLILVRFE
jgi:uncharacterized delta-60 repeat protein